MQENLKIQKQLQKLRQQCVKEYLETKLQAISSKEVIHDILIGFLQTNNRQFLQNISNSIHEVKQNNKQLKDSISQIKQQHAATIKIEVQQATKSLKITHQDYVKQLVQQNNELKLQIQAQSIQYNKKIIEIIEEIQMITTQKNEVQNNLIDAIKNNKLFEMEIQNFKFQIQNQSEDDQHQKQKAQQKIRAYEGHINLLQKEKTQFSLQYCQNINKLNEFIRLLQEKEINQRNHYEFVLINSQKIKQQLKSQNLVLNLKLSEQQLKKQQKTRYINSLTEANAQLLAQFKQSEQKNELLRHDLQKNQSSLEHYRQENDYLLIQLEIINSSFAVLTNKYAQTQKQQKINYQKMEKNMNTQILQKQQEKQKQIISIKRQIQVLTQENGTLKRKTSQKQKQEESLKERIQQMKEQINFLQINLQKNMQQNKSLINYNNIQNQQLQRCEYLIDNASQKSQQYKEIIHSNSLQINKMQLAIIEYKNDVESLNKNIAVLQQSLEMQKEKKTYYSLYLEEIAFLKKQLLKYRPTKSQFFYQNAESSQINKVYRKSKFYMQILNFKQALNLLTTQNKELKNMFKQLSFYYKEQLSKTVTYIVNTVQSQSLKCLYCQHKQENTKTNIKNNQTKLSFDKTVLKNNGQIGNYSSIKKNLQYIQQRYNQINQQNYQFTSYIDNILNKQ